MQLPNMRIYFVGDQPSNIGWLFWHRKCRKVHCTKIGGGRHRIVTSQKKNSAYGEGLVYSNQCLAPYSDKPKKDNICCGGLGLLQMVLEPDTGRRVSDEVEPWMRVDKTVCQQGRWASKGVDWGSHIDWRMERVPARTLGPKGGWIVRSHIGWGGERNILHKGVETSRESSYYCGESWFLTWYQSPTLTFLFDIWGFYWHD